MNNLDEAELKVMTQNLYNHGGAENVLDCVKTMNRCILIILQKLNEILDEKEKN
jgi:hypothetical protein